MKSTMIGSMQKQLSLHKSLYELATAKTEILKKNNIEGLQEILQAEQKHIATINQLEKQRISQTGEDSFQSFLGDEIEDEIILLRNELLHVITQLKQKNELNQKLIEQSLQFVHLSLDLIYPDPEPYTYGRQQNENKDDQKPVRSIFDSKA